MADSKHTPGPWCFFVGNSNSRGLIRIEADVRSPAAGTHIASSARGGSSEANARLMAASPELLNELDARVGDLTMLIKAIDADDPKAELLIRAGDMLRETRAAISKATGA